MRAPAGPGGDKFSNRPKVRQRSAGWPPKELALARVRHIPERSCVSCAQKLPKRELIRIVKTPQGNVHVDPDGRSSGRGAYLCRTESCWEKGVEKGSLERSLKLEISATDKASLMSYFNSELFQAPLVGLEQESPLTRIIRELDDNQQPNRYDG
ncbi:MAG: hypothetical protein BZY75_04205 [SAR202 cluster bacterium Io17-Chloro-G7]|nr:MAG: hypothetical protein BZY75_04205 [SAR202 cluster bacterium Io17-Chloro-G7]